MGPTSTERALMCGCLLLWYWDDTIWVVHSFVKADDVVLAKQVTHRN